MHILLHAARDSVRWASLVFEWVAVDYACFETSKAWVGHGRRGSASGWRREEVINNNVRYSHTTLGHTLEGATSQTSQDFDSRQPPLSTEVWSIYVAPNNRPRLSVGLACTLFNQQKKSEVPLVLRNLQLRASPSTRLLKFAFVFPMINLKLSSYLHHDLRSPSKRCLSPRTIL